MTGAPPTFSITEADPCSRITDSRCTTAAAPGRWISINFSTPGDGDLESEFTGVLVELFDAVVGTFRWSYE
ncbi:hypothetical protein FE633_29395 [Streptomyces montanus]|uniref:Uncharacterized protein n=1 Tax=Streptomyces montanus TaxID=2580423 RepID=A0A5R9FTA3_9ACTN|nr:hypothetical protein [Streptomyces montanus]TLS42765.1 hypothetical protein FE633_29395 [Streptomyces montanus]